MYVMYVSNRKIDALQTNLCIFYLKITWTMIFKLSVQLVGIYRDKLIKVFRNQSLMVYVEPWVILFVQWSISLGHMYNYRNVLVYGMKDIIFFWLPNGSFMWVRKDLYQKLFHPVWEWQILQVSIHSKNIPSEWQLN